MRRLVAIPGLLLFLTLVGTTGFRLIEGAPWLDCLYMAVITLTTVGFEEAVPLSSYGKLFVICYLIVGLGVFTYSATTLGQWIVNIRMMEMREKRRMEKTIRGLSNHFIVCGCGRMGTVIAQYLNERHQTFIALDRDEEVISQCRERGWHYILGDSTDDDVLMQAGIERARSLATVLPTDADNLYVTLSARMLNARLQIIARASDEKAIQKLDRAGANRVISPFSSGAIKMARIMLHPNIEDFLEITDSRGSDHELADVQVGVDSPYIGKRLAETDLRQRGVMVVGIRRASGKWLMPPSSEAVIEAGDCLFAFGTADSVNNMISDTHSSDA